MNNYVENSLNSLKLILHIIITLEVNKSAVLVAPANILIN